MHNLQYYTRNLAKVQLKTYEKQQINICININHMCKHRVYNQMLFCITIWEKKPRPSNQANILSFPEETEIQMTYV